MRRLLAAALAIGVLTVQLTSAIPASAAPGDRGCTTARGTANLLSDRGNKVVGTYTHTATYCWSWIGNPSHYTINSVKRSATWKIQKDDKKCAAEVFSQWANDPRRSADQVKKHSEKTWDSTMGHDFLRNYFVQTFEDDHKCTFKYAGQLLWRPRVVLRLKLPKPSVVSAPPVKPNA